MSTLDSLSTPTETELVVAFFDLTRFASFVNTLSPQDCFKFISDYYEFVGDVLERDEGLVVKFIGDAGLVVYPAENADNAVVSLKRLKDEGDAWLRDRGADCRHVVKAHVGPVMCGAVGTRSQKRFDVFGTTVNTAALLKSNGFAMTPQLFRKLSSKTRTLFKKHTPPITYIPTEERHRD